MALESSEGDPSRAIRVLGTFGHDDVMRGLKAGENEAERIRILNSFQPVDFQSLLYENGAIAGLEISEKMRAQFAELKSELDERLSRLARQTGRTRAFYFTQLIKENIEDLEDRYLAEARLEKRGKRYTSAQVRRQSS